MVTLVLVCNVQRLDYSWKQVLNSQIYPQKQNWLSNMFHSGLQDCPGEVHRLNVLLILVPQLTLS